MDSKSEYSNVPSSEDLSRDSMQSEMEKSRFLTDELSDKRDERSTRLKKWWSCLATMGLPWLLVVCLSITLSILTFSKSHQGEDSGWAPYSPVPSEGFEYHDVVFKRDFGPERKYFSEYSGWPTDEIEMRWKALYDDGFTAISEESHKQLLNKSVRTPMLGKEDTHMVVLDVFHQLHCLNTIRRYFYPRRYNLSLFEEDGRVSYQRWIHVDHCIDIIRQSLMCNADPAANGYDWFPSIHYLRIHLNSVHRCRNWDYIRNWASENSVRFNGHMAHVDENTGHTVDYGKDADPGAVTLIDDDSFRYTRDDM